MIRKAVPRRGAIRDSTKSYKPNSLRKQPTNKQYTTTTSPKKYTGSVGTTKDSNRKSTLNLSKADVKAKMRRRFKDIGEGKYQPVVRRRKGEYGLGGLIGTGVGAIAGSIIPGAGTAVGASIGGALGGNIDGMIANKKAQQVQQVQPTTVAAGSHGQFATGGEVDPKLPSQMSDKDRLKKHSKNSIARWGMAGANFHARARHGIDNDSSETYINQLRQLGSNAYDIAQSRKDDNKEIDAIEEKAGKLLPKMVRYQVNENLNNVREMSNGNFANGGQTSPPWGEQSYTPARGGKPTKIAGNAYQFTGNSHANGGIQLNDSTEIEGNETMDKVKGQDYVFSARLTVPGSKKTFAQKHKELKEQGAGNLAIDSLSKMQEREAGRGKPTTQGYDFNVVGGEMALGGATDPIPEITVTGQGFSNPSYQPIGVSSGVGSFSGSNNFRKVNPTNIPKAKTFKSKSGINIDGNVGETALQLAPDVINLATGVFGKDKTKPATKVGRTKINRTASRYNVNPQLNANRAGYRAILSDPNATINQKLASQSMKQQGDSQAYATKNNADSQMDASYDQAQARYDSFANSAQAQMDEQHRQDKMASEANLGISGNFARGSMASMANKILQLKGQKNLSKRDKELLEMYKKVYG